MKETTFFEKVSVEDEFPKKVTRYPVKFESNDYFSSAYFNGQRFEIGEHMTITHWLRETKGILLSKEESENLMPFEFIQWYSGMEKEKILRAYERWKVESKGLLTKSLTDKKL